MTLLLCSSTTRCTTPTPTSPTTTVVRRIHSHADAVRQRIQSRVHRVGDFPREDANVLQRAVRRRGGGGGHHSVERHRHETLE